MRLNKKIKYIVFAFLCMSVSPLMIFADCDYQRQAELSRLASNVQLSYLYNDKDFTIFMTNLTDDLYVVDDYGRTYYGAGEKTFHYYSGTVNFNIYSNDANCRGEMLLTKTITLPTLNIYASREECQRYPNFEYCQKWGNFTFDDDQFDTALNNYEQKLNKKIQEKASTKKDFLQIIVEELHKNIFMFIFIGFVLLIYIIYCLLKKRRR